MLPAAPDVQEKWASKKPELVSGWATASHLRVEQGTGVFGQRNISFEVSVSSSVGSDEG